MSKVLVWGARYYNILKILTNREYMLQLKQRVETIRALTTTRSVSGTF